VSRVEIKIGGFGGQGVILAGMIIGRAASIYDNKDATLTQSFGPEARGGACSAQVVVGTTRNLYPCVTSPDVLVMMSQPAYDRFIGEIRDDGLLLFEESLVKPAKLPPKVKSYSIPATRFAEELGRKMVLNIIMVGFFTSLSDVVSRETVEKSVVESVPKGTEKLNLNAFLRGYNYGLELRDK
jgi:2-oxoglutarate ferredoxin oxidoreductase subunit gamma